MAKLFNDQGGMDKVIAHLEVAKARMPEAIRLAHDHCTRNRQEVLSSNVAGCFYCRETFVPSEICEWTDDEDVTALCPKCGTAGLSLTKDFLDEMHRYWFDETIPGGE